MADREKVFDALRNCVTEPKCKDCPWEDCEKIGCKRTTVPVTLLLDTLNLLKEQPQWISVKDRMPKTEQHVLVSIKTAYGNCYTTVAAHVGYHERNSESDGWSLECEIDWDEYDEKNDWYWVPECWYEVNFVDDNTNWIIDKVDGEITHWMPLPKYPEVKQDD